MGLGEPSPKNLMGESAIEQADHPNGGKGTINHRCEMPEMTLNLQLVQQMVAALPGADRIADIMRSRLSLARRFS